jgi:AcrR family transcriptional regulator
MGAKAAAPGRNREATRNAILEATSQLIAEKGVDGFTMSEVAARGRINRALIYHYFQNRDNLVFETIRHIVRLYEAVSEGSGADPLERSIRLHIEHPEIARFLLQMMLSGRPIPRLSSRLLDAIKELEELKAAAAPGSSFDPTFAIIIGWLIQLSWSCGREEIARLLGLSVAEADRRLIDGVRRSSQLIRGQVARSGAHATDQP